MLLFSEICLRFRKEYERVQQEKISYKIKMIFSRCSVFLNQVHLLIEFQFNSSCAWRSDSNFFLVFLYNAFYQLYQLYNVYTQQIWLPTL